MVSVDFRGGDNNFSSEHPVIISPRFNKFFRTHERVIRQIRSIDFSIFQPELSTPEDRAAVRAAMLVESHNPVYTEGILGYFRGQSDEQEMASFTQTWGYEEMRHYFLLRTYLEASGLVDNQELGKVLKVTRAGPWGERELKFSRVEAFVYPMMQEQVTAGFYKRFAEATKEPLLQEILRIISKDEYRHCQYYFEKAQEELNLGGDRKRQARSAIIGFYMPGESFIESFEDEVVKPAAEIVPFDLSSMGELVDKVGKLIGPLELARIAADPAFHRRLRDEFNLDPMSVLRSRSK